MKKRDSHSIEMRNHQNGGSQLRDIILGGQDGVVNVLGTILGVAVATGETRIVIIAGLAATFAESISMGAVAYTSTEATQAYAKRLEQLERHEIEKHPKEEKKELAYIFAHKGIKGKLLSKVVERITASKRRWLLTMMAEELHVSSESVSPLKSAFVVFFASLVGSLIPLTPFFFLPVNASMLTAVGVCSLVLFLTGAYKAKLTVGVWWKSGISMMLIGILSALAGYAIGSALGVVL